MGMKVYFAGAIKGDTSHESAQASIIRYLKEEAQSHGNLTVWHERSPDYQAVQPDIGPEEVFERDRDWLNEADALIAEISGESFGTGWEIGYAQKFRRIPVLCLAHADAAIPPLVAGNTLQNFATARYSGEEELKASLAEYVRLLFEDPTGKVATRAFDMNRPDEPEGVEEALWIESRWKENKQIGMASFVPGNRPEDKAEMTHLHKALGSPGVRQAEGFGDARRLFRFITSRIRQARRLLLISDASKPSTELGWLYSFAQYFGVRFLSPYRAGIDVSWILLGQRQSQLQLAAEGEISLEEAIEIATASVNTDRHHISGRHGRGRRLVKLPPVTPLPYQSTSDLLAKLPRYLSYLETEFFRLERRGDKERTERLFPQGNVQAWDSLSSQELEWLIAESLLRNIFWEGVTVEGIQNSFLSGERLELVSLLHFHDLCPSPKTLFKRVRHAINYEERALAKNIRAFREIGILAKRVVREPARAPGRQTHLESYGVTSVERTHQTTLEKYFPRRTFVQDLIVLTAFGRRLAAGLQDPMARRILPWIVENNCLRTNSHERGKLQSELTNPHTYLLGSLSEETREVLFPWVQRLITNALEVVDSRQDRSSIESQ